MTWAANIITRKFRPPRNKAMVYNVKRSFESLNSKAFVKWTWTKRHAGNAYNEVADRLADKRKSTGQYAGGRSQQSPSITPHSLSREAILPLQDDPETLNQRLIHSTHNLLKLVTL